MILEYVFRNPKPSDDICQNKYMLDMYAEAARDARRAIEKIRDDKGLDLTDDHIQAFVMIAQHLCSALDETTVQIDCTSSELNKLRAEMPQAFIDVAIAKIVYKSSQT